MQPTRTVLPESHEHLPQTDVATLAAEGDSVIWTFITFLIVLWLLGWGFHVAGNLIHVLLVVALVLAIANFLMGKKTV